MSPLFYAVGASGIFSHYTFAAQRYNNFWRNANKNRFWGDFFSGGRKEYSVEVGSCAKRSLKFKV